MPNKNRIEIISGVGDFPCLYAAVKAKADAIYFGVKGLNMRDFGKNFTIKELPLVVEYCHKNKVKAYLALNTIVYDKEQSLVKRILNVSKKAKIDAVICSDFLIFQESHRLKIPIHISTQMSVSNSSACNFLVKCGAKRIVLARELNLKQIKKISKIIPIEIFIHGAMCVAVSGRCFTSQFLFNKSANRGQCLHPCRRSYQVKDEEGNELKVENNKIFSAKDLCTLPFIEKMKKAGIKSFKIEGRNRDARYVDAVVRIYRKALDEKLNKKELEYSIKELEKIYNKGYSSGFYIKIPTADDFAKIEHNASAEKKHFVGKVTHYFDKAGVAAIKLVSELKVGDKIIIIGKITGIVHSTINSMEIKNKKINLAKKGDEIGIKIQKIRTNDEVYLIKKIKN